MEALIELARRRGFVYPGSAIYGGLANSWDYGPLGVELKKNIMDSWWDMFVRNRQDMVGIDAAIIMNPKVWEASGHVSAFTDPLVECRACHSRHRADHIDLTGECPTCGAAGQFTDPAQFNLMFKTWLGVKEDATALAYMRGELAQAMFVDFPLVLDSSRKRLPFGIAQQGKCFRNEITPGNFIFRTREFNLMELEYFVRESEWREHFEYWLTQMKAWCARCGIREDHLYIHEIEDGERAHYSARTIDIEYEYPFGRKELYGLAYRGNYDLTQHAKASGQSMVYTDPVSGEKFIPHVIEPSFGIDRTLLAVLNEAYTVEESSGGDEEAGQRVVLKLPFHLAPVKVAVLPLSKKEPLTGMAQKVIEVLSGVGKIEYDETQSIGRRYRRQDEIGTPLCVTIDFETVTDNCVTVRHRDDMRQERVPVDQVRAMVSSLLYA